MLKRLPLYVVALFSVALFMTAGCATQDVVKKDEGIVPAPVARKADQTKSSGTQSQQAVTTPMTQIVPAPAAAQQSQKASSTSQLQAALKKIYFDFDSADLSDSARGTLTKNVAVLKKESSAKIRIEGNCDESGSAEYNLALGERRAKSAQQYLIALGVKPEQLSTMSYGKEKPAVQGSDEAAGTKNRRDEFVVVTP
jgi:peptidoglycan-associated lipoprotein